MEQIYAREHTEEAVRKLKELGDTMGVIHFYKGFGLEAEKQHMADAGKLTALLKQNGLRVGVYVGSTIAFETFLSEKPEARVVRPGLPGQAGGVQQSDLPQTRLLHAS